MKRLHRKDLWSWSTFSTKINADFHGIAWVREGGNVVIDPVEMTTHDRDHLASLGAEAWPRRRYLARLAANAAAPSLHTSWADWAAPAP